jgi:Tfp pilus assembly protein PilF
MYRAGVLVSVLAITATGLAATGCAPLTAQRLADESFRRALSAHFRGDLDTAEREYRRAVDTGAATSATYNNLALIVAKRDHDYRRAHRLFAEAVERDDRDLVALTNYGVMSYWLDDLAEAERALVDARNLRLRSSCQLPSMGRVNWESEECVRATEALDQIASRYLARIAQAEARAHLAREPLLVADLQIGRM